jgi:hypothetical protein
VAEEQKIHEQIIFKNIGMWTTVSIIIPETLIPNVTSSLDYLMDKENHRI